MKTKTKILLSAMTLTMLSITVPAEPIPLYDHSYRSFNAGRHYQLLTPQISELWDVHNITMQFSNRYYYSKDTALVNNRWLFHFADSINFHNLDFNFRIRLDSPGWRVRDAGWSSERAGEKNDPGFVYDPDRIVAHYTSSSERFRFGFGKDRYNWGPLELGGLLLSDYNEGFSGFYQQYTLGSFVLRGLTTQLNSMRLDQTGITHRYFSASRLEYYKPAYGLAFGQSMIYTGLWRSWDIRYFFPFYIFHYAQMTAGGDHGYGNAGQNSMGSLDGYMKIYRLPLEVYGELLVDDFQGHSDEVSQSRQNTVSWMLGLRLKSADPWYGFVEGGKVSTYSYNHAIVPKRYMINNSFIGSPLGPDQQLLWGKFGRAFYNDNLKADLNFWLRRSGERHGRDTLFTIPDASLNGTRGDKQPFGTVEDELSLWGSVKHHGYFVDVEARSGMTLYRNRGNEESGWARYPFFGIFLSTGLSVRAER